MIRLVLLLCFSVFISVIQAQNELTGVINAYAEVEAIEPENCYLRLQVSDTTGFTGIEQVVIIQMQGATINTSNSSSFGDLTNIGSAGLYEIGQVDSVGANDLFLPFELVNTYDLNGRVQVVSMPKYESATVMDTLRATPWNGSIGGIVALEVSDTLLLNAPIDLNGAGFRGGLSQTNLPNDCSWLFNENDYAYDLNNWRGAAKGEGIAIIATNQEAGRGAQANGGGGGNDHNSGGGGGGNVVPGGQGGENDEPSLFGCQGEFPGRGGKPNLAEVERLYLGGGGGAGHANNNVGTDGGRGGGILILVANTIEAEDQFIHANGQAVIDGGGDGGGGGGAGGAVVLDFNVLAGSLTVECLGGQGGVVDNNSQDRCHGPGGGGSGGRLLLTTPGVPALLSVDLSGGDAGQTINSGACPDGNNGATAGADGAVELFPAVIRGDEPIAPAPPNAIFSFGILGSSVSFNNLSVDANSYLWHFGDNNSSNQQNPTHTYDQDGTYTVQLIAFGLCGIDTATLNVVIMAEALPNVFFTSTDANGCSPIAIIYTDLSTANITSREWTFPGGTPNSSADPNPTVFYNTPGTYDVILQATNSAGSDLFIAEDYVNVSIPVMADFGYSISGNTVDFINLASNAEQFEWNFGDGSPGVEAVAPSHTYAQPGIYDVTMIASNDDCASVITQEIFLGFTGTAELAALKLSLFPNPLATDNRLQITATQPAIEGIELQAISGQVVLSQRFGTAVAEAAMSLERLPAGLYLVRVETTEGIWLEKLIVSPR